MPMHYKTRRHNAMQMTPNLILLSPFTAVLSLADDGPRLAPDLANLEPDQSVDIIVRFKVQPTARHHLRFTQHGGKLKRNLEILRGAAYSVAASSLQDLANDPDIEYITPDRMVKATLDYAEPAINASTALTAAWNGSGVTVAVIDRGIMDSHPELQDSSGKSRVVYAEDFNPIVPGAESSNVATARTKAS